MPTIREAMAANGAFVQEKLDQVEQLVRGLAHAILFSVGDRATAWDIANRVCDSYCIPKAV